MEEGEEGIFSSCIQLFYLDAPSPLLGSCSTLQRDVVSGLIEASVKHKNASVVKAPNAHSSVPNPMLQVRKPRLRL